MRGAGRGGFEMNVVSSPALASFFAAAADGFLCMEATCLLGWAWTLAALTFLSVAIAQRWQSGGDEAGPHLLRVSPVPAAAAVALLPRLPGLAPLTRAPVRPTAEPAPRLSLRAPPLNFERAVVSPVISPADDAPFTPLARRPGSRRGSPGTPTSPESPGRSGRYPPG